MSKIEEKLKTLIEQNTERAKKVEELTNQIEQFKQGIQVLKEEHDFTRGQIVALQDLAAESEESDSKSKGKK
tara:strand:+ start:101 stop:316 length:216 start_codon:yes stop_codon:yes gene_type:complete